MERTSSRIITNILESINDADFFLADISDLNPNVLFEAGYAFGRQKRILLFSQGFSSQQREKDLKDLEMLSGWDISPYQNREDMAATISGKNPFIHKTQPEIMKYGVNLDQPAVPERGLFLKGSCNAEMAVVALQRLREILPQTHVDDWGEDSSQPLLWYLREVLAAQGIVALFVNPAWDNGRRMNARFSFVCGLAVALGKSIRMIGLPGFETPFDYKELMVRPSNSDQVRLHLQSAFPIDRVAHEAMQANDAGATLSNQLTPAKVQVLDRELILLDINVGNTIAENEESELGEYFVQTGQYHQALQRRQSVIVGNKGSGKTALFFQVRDHFQQHAENLVCEIKPVDYKMARFLSNLKKLEDSNGIVGHVVESTWKLIIYCELLNSLHRQVAGRPLAAGMSSHEQSLARFISTNEHLIAAPFEQKLELVSDWMDESSFHGDNFTKLIHDRFLSSAKTVLQPLIATCNRIVVLVDNLDKAWVVDGDLPLQTQVVFSLLGIHRRMRGDFGDRPDITILVFLRRNIYECCLTVAREPDKLLADSIELMWNDPEMLLRVLKERFEQAVERNGGNSASVPWTSFFTRTVDGMPVSSWIYQSILPRPRDLIHIVTKAIEWAINRGHNEIMEADLKSALMQYSAFALEQVTAEYRAEEPWLPTVLRSFAGGPPRYSEAKLRQHLSGVTMSARVNLYKMVETLVRVGFLGIRFGTNTTTFAIDLETSQTLVAQVRSHLTDKPLVYEIQPVYHQHLQIHVQGNHEAMLEPNATPTTNSRVLLHYPWARSMLLKLKRLVRLPE